MYNRALNEVNKKMSENFPDKIYANIGLMLDLYSSISVGLLLEKSESGKGIKVKEKGNYLLLNEEKKLRLDYKHILELLQCQGDVAKFDTLIELKHSVAISLQMLEDMLLSSGGERIENFKPAGGYQCITMIQEGKLIQSGPKSGKLPKGWVEIGGQTYCYRPDLDYVVLNDLMYYDGDDLTIIKF